VRAAVGHTAPLTYNSTTGVFGISQSNITTDGYLSSIDWNTFNDKQPLIACGTTSQYYRGDKTFQTLDTSVVTEGTNLYFTNSRARAAICAGSGISYNSTSGQITNSCPDQIVSLMGGGTTSITGTYPNFTITSNDTYLGTVTCVAVSGTNITVTGSPITSSGTIGLSIGSFDICNALGFSPYNSTNPAGYTTCTGTVTSVASCTSTTGVSLSGSPISMSGTLGIDISTASATCTGLLNSFDWNTFNNKTSCTGTVSCVAASTFTTGVSISGSPITSSGTLDINISTASLFCTGLLTSTDWNTFNSKSSCLGTVTCVGLISATPGVTIGNSPITSSGDITLNIATASAVCTGLLTSADWNTFNSHTGCTGTVTFVNATGTNISVTGGPITTSGTLNISLSGADVCSALGYTPYNATNPNGYTTCTGTVTSVGIVATNINVCASPVTTSGDICLNLTGANVCAALGYSPVIGSLTSGYIPKATGSASLSDGLLYDNGSAVLLGTVTSGSGKFIVYSANPDNHYQAVGSAPSFRFADTIIAPTYTSIIGLATATNNFLIGAAAGDMVLANNTSSIGNFLFGTGATERMRINANGNVSIGGTGNTYKLDVTGTTNITGQLTLGSTITNGTYTYTLPGATGTLALTSAIPANPVGGTGTTNYLSKFTAASTIGNSLVYDNGTNVGIGTTSPNHILTANNSASGGTYLGLYQSYVDGNDWRNWTIGTNNQAFGDFAIAQSNATGGNPLSAGTIRMYISKAGNVGIGTTTPAQALDVNSASSTDTDLKYNLVVRSSDAFSTTPQAGIAFATYFNGSSNLPLVGIYGGKENATSGDFAGKLSFATRPNGGNITERVRITSAGNVGIGTTSPNAKLQVVGDTAGSMIKATYSTFNDSRSTYIDWGGIKTTASTTNNNMEITMEGGSSSSGAIIFKTGLTTATERARITNGGFVGIGVTPSAWNLGTAVQINSTTSLFNDGSGNSYIGNNFYYNSAFLYTTTANAVSYVLTSTGEHRWNTAPSGTAGTAITFTQAMTLTAAGNLGLGITTPQNTAGYSSFSVNGTSGGQMTYHTAGTKVGYIFNTSTNMYFGGESGVGLIFNAGGSERAKITSTGTLQVNGGDIIGGPINNDYGSLTLRGGYGITTSQGSRIEIRGYEGGGTTQGAIMLYTNNIMRVKVYQSGLFNLSNVPVYASNALAIAGGLVSGDFYKSSTGVLSIVY
jgi:hypothetical protein